MQLQRSIYHETETSIKNQQTAAVDHLDNNIKRLSKPDDINNKKTTVVQELVSIKRSSSVTVKKQPKNSSGIAVAASVPETVIANSNVDNSSNNSNINQNTNKVIQVSRVSNINISVNINNRLPVRSSREAVDESQAVKNYVAEIVSRKPYAVYFSHEWKVPVGYEQIVVAAPKSMNFELIIRTDANYLHSANSMPLTDFRRLVAVNGAPTFEYVNFWNNFYLRES